MASTVLAFKGRGHRRRPNFTFPDEGSLKRTRYAVRLALFLIPKDFSPGFDRVFLSGAHAPTVGVCARPLRARSATKPSRHFPHLV